MTEPKTKRFQILITPEQNARLFRLSKLEMIPRKRHSQGRTFERNKKKRGEKENIERGRETCLTANTKNAEKQLNYNRRKNETNKTKITQP